MPSVCLYFQIHQPLDDATEKCQFFRLSFVVLKRLNDSDATSSVGQKDRSAALADLVHNSAWIHFHVTQRDDIFRKFGFVADVHFRGGIVPD